MGECTVCNVCTNPGRFEDSTESNKIPNSIRMFKNDPNEKYTVWRCRSCGSLHSKEEIDLAYYYKYYPLKQHRLDFWARRAYNNRLKRLIKEGLKPEHEILDFGCGKGLFISYLKEKGYKNVIGYDAYVPEFSDEGILSRTYDVVVAQDVIEHVDDPMTLMDQLVRCLRLGGILCIGTPNADRLDLMHPEKFIMTFQQPYHRHILSEKALIQLGINRGLKIGKIYHRWYYDTLYPTVNLRFIQNYVRRAGNVLDIVVEPPRVGMVLTSPLLMFYAFFGYFFPPRTEMMIFFHQSHVVNNRQSGSLKEE